MEAHKITISKTARYFTYGNANSPARVWFVLHGYGQLAEYFIRNFSALDPKENLVVAPEGFHRFYLDGTHGRVGATWMTKESRLEDISDYIQFLDQVYLQAIAPALSANAELIGFGFSQGVATISRYIAMGEAKFDKAIFWGGAFPPDLAPAQILDRFADLPTYCLIGTEDQYIDASMVARIKSHLEALNINASWISYEGKHAIPKKALTSFIEKYLN